MADLPISLSLRRTPTNKSNPYHPILPEQHDEIRLLASRFWRVAPQRRRRKYGSVGGLRKTAPAAQRTNRLRPHPPRRIKSQRHQKRPRPFSPRLVHPPPPFRPHP